MLKLIYQLVGDVATKVFLVSKHLALIPISFHL